MKKKNLKSCIDAALGREAGDLLIKNCRGLNVFTGEFESCDILVKDGYIVSMYASDKEAKAVVDAEGMYAVPGFIDGHMHLESTVISPLEFSRIAAAHGTSAAVVDPHEFANVLGTDGIDYILESTRDLPVDMYVMVPSCVPATYVDESGAVLTHRDTEKYMGRERVLGLAEMMNYPGVLSADADVLAKIDGALSSGKCVDGHAPSLSGAELDAYCASGVNSDHECTTAEEALEKLCRGQWIMIREGTACKNLEALVPILKNYPWRCVFACDDKHPADLVRDGHIDHIIRRAIAFGVPAAVAYTVASHGAATRFGLADSGALAPGYKADIVLVSELDAVKIEQVYKDGILMSAERIAAWEQPKVSAELEARVRDTVNIAPVTAESFDLRRVPEHVIKLVPWQIVTEDGGTADGVDTEKDIVKLCVVERHKASGHIGVALLSGYGLKHGAVATTVAHDSHNIIVCGVSDEDIALAVSRLSEIGGGMVIAQSGEIKDELALPIAGLVTDLSAAETAEAIERMRASAHALGVSEDIDPFMTLSFAALPVIPARRLTTLGVFDVGAFKII